MVSQAPSASPADARGGMVTGFFGGLTGQQGAFRSMFLLRLGLPADRFIATGVMIAILVDLSRLTTYTASFTATGLHPSGREGLLVVVGTLFAFAGAYVGYAAPRKDHYRNRPLQHRCADARDRLGRGDRRPWLMSASTHRLTLTQIWKR